MDQKTKIRKFISEKLKELNLSMDDFFKQCGFSRATYYNITAKPSSMTLEQIDNICKTLNISYVEFSIVIGRFNPFELLHPMPISKARDIIYENKSLLNSLNIKMVDLSDAEIIQVASVLEIIMSWAFSK